MDLVFTSRLHCSWKMQLPFIRLMMMDAGWTHCNSSMDDTLMIARDGKYPTYHGRGNMIEKLVRTVHQARCQYHVWIYVCEWNAIATSNNHVCLFCQFGSEKKTAAVKIENIKLWNSLCLAAQFSCAYKKMGDKLACVGNNAFMRTQKYYNTSGFGREQFPVLYLLGSNYKKNATLRDRVSTIY